MDDQKVAHKDIPEVIRFPETQNREVYLGWPTEVGGRQTGNVTVDELQFWYASRDALDLDPSESSLSSSTLSFLPPSPSSLT